MTMYLWYNLLFLIDFIRVPPNPNFSLYDCYMLLVLHVSYVCSQTNLTFLTDSERSDWFHYSHRVRKWFYLGNDSYLLIKNDLHMYFIILQTPHC